MTWREMSTLAALLSALMVTVVLVSWGAAADPGEDFGRRYEAIAVEARSVWHKAQRQ